ncbi:branched-chain amino acid ABC transporter permease [Methylobacterium sp. J-048]|uniref:branched-chain amino acid ABC transporter permease n=1 Tax=Methylobacterium sp. J-048 TaxID=2836635 RepID=UPI001FBB45D7|nr:branched-chain amino acid ABC transporter permease [Methylobacterium sp. J-048]MCJ2056962.1 branched-chain amino acid ABC transporter permease [Methylobacterium sp. J-048]
MAGIASVGAQRTLPAGVTSVALVALVAVGIVPLIGTSYLYEAILTPFLALALAGLGLNLLTGYAGLLSLGSAAFMAVGAYAAFNLSLRLPFLPLPVVILIAGGVAALTGVIAGLPALRLRGFYLAVSTLAVQFFVAWALNRIGWLSNDSPSGIVSAPRLIVAGISFEDARGRYLFSLAVVALLSFAAWRLVRSPTGRDLVAIRDHEIAARITGVRVARTKLLAFALSSFIVGVAGVLWAFAYLRTLEPAGFNLDRSFQILFIVIIGGLGTLRGAFLGAGFIVVLPLVLARLGAAMLGDGFDSGTLEMCQRMVLGTLIVAVLIREPAGLTALLDRAVGRLRGRAD